ncbi:hypothetical protein [Microbacterium lacticum]|uniref:Uncharacterized protein n=1 Tax=Microbacterium lacticum TaxID=33885 RepID=A0A4Y3URW9_9MICO|nr:hypothetical protein [Microbacterium lacticum]TQM98262.1 hypothetical protein FHX68_2306 [Microbacterium lacticum]GEB96120.1 hypothetical protein MLA01_23390 [Microbacterium lacticum]GGI72094.1 hypothetical protein GCM10009724_23830 [Microbacterium lacticum]
MDPAKAGWRISDLVAYDSATADVIAKIAALAARADVGTTLETVDAIRAELRELADGATP